MGRFAFFEPGVLSGFDQRLFDDPVRSVSLIDSIGEAVSNLSDPVVGDLGEVAAVIAKHRSLARSHNEACRKKAHAQADDQDQGKDLAFDFFGYKFHVLMA